MYHLGCGVDCGGQNHLNAIREQHHRLPDNLYCGRRVISFTACMRNRTSFFTTRERFRACEQLLIISLEKFQCGAEIYIFMPDHVHFLLRGLSDAANALASMRYFKQQSGFWLSREYPGVRWQKDFYDRILRTEHEVGTCIAYVLNNPVKKGIAKTWIEYPYRGSTIHRLEEWQSSREQP